MEKKEFEKYFKSQVETLFEKFNSTQIVIDYSKNIANINFMNESVGKIEFNFLTGRKTIVNGSHSEYIHNCKYLRRGDLERNFRKY